MIAKFVVYSSRLKQSKQSKSKINIVTNCACLLNLWLILQGQNRHKRACIKAHTKRAISGSDLLLFYPFYQFEFLPLQMGAIRRYGKKQ